METALLSVTLARPGVQAATARMSGEKLLKLPGALVSRPVKRGESASSSRGLMWSRM